MQTPLDPSDEHFRTRVVVKLESTDNKLNALLNRVSELEAEQSRIKYVMEVNADTIATVANNTHEMLKVFESWKGAMRVLEMIGKAAKPLGYIAMLISASIGGWVTYKNGGAPRL